jgi:hypothetical protein
MSDFFKFLGEKYSRYPQVKLNRSLVSQVQELVVTKLNLSNLNEVRDKFEGQKYLDNQVVRVLSRLALFEFYGKKKPTIDLSWLSSEPNLFPINDKLVSILATPFGELPSFKAETGVHDVVLLYHKDTITFSVIGVLSCEDVKYEIRRIGRDSHLRFTDFDKLKTLEGK